MDAGDSDFGLARPHHLDDSDAESTLADQDSGALQNVADTLRKENSVLRAQFDQAVGLTQGINDLHQKNSKLTAAVRNLESEKSDLSRRLDIALRANEELSSQLATEKEATTHHLSRETADKEREIAKIREQADSKIESLLQRAKAAEEETEKHALHNRMFKNKLEQLKQSASSHFGRSLSDLDEVIEALSRPFVPEIPRKTEDSQVAILSEQFDAAVAKLKKDKSCLKAARKETESLKAEIFRLRRELSDSEKRAEQQARAFESRFSEADEEATSKLAEGGRVIEDLHVKNEALRNEIALLRRQQKEVKVVEKRPLPELNLQLPELKKPDPTKEFRNEIENLKQTVSELGQKLRAAESRKDELTDKLGQAESRNSKLEVDVEKAKSELSSLRTVHAESQNEIATLRESLHAKPPSSRSSPEARMIRKLKNHVRTLAQTIKSQDTTIHDLAIERENQRQQIEKLQSKLESLSAEHSENQSRIAGLKSELNEARIHSQERRSVSADDLIPISAWRSCEFESGLEQQIERVAANPSLQPASKLNQIYKLIHKYFAAHIRDVEERVEDRQREIEQIRGIVNQFAVDISISLSLDAISFENFVGGGHQKIAKAITQTVQNLDEAKRVNYQFTALTEHVTALFGDGADLFTKIAEIRETCDRQTEIAKAKSRKNRDLRAKLQALKRSSDQKIDTLTEENAELASTAADLQQRATENAELIKQLKADRTQARQELKNLENAAADSALALRVEQDKASKDHQSESDYIQRQLSEHVQRLTDELTRAGEAIEANESSIAKLQKQLQNTQKQLTDKTGELAELENAKDSELSTLHSQAKAERDNLVRTYEKALTELKDQCDAHRTDLERISVDLARSEERVRKAKSVVCCLKRERCKLGNEIKSLKEKHERDAQVAQATIKSVSLSAESSLSQRVQELKMKFENEKRRLFALAADEFRTFFNAAESIDERSYQALLGRVKTELRRLADSEVAVRRLVGAGPRQATDDAVAQLLIH
jgi:chromosome segregation ATPase